MHKLCGPLAPLVLAGLWFSQAHAAPAKEPERRSKQPVLARSRERVLPLTAKGARNITVDGDLTDWAGVTVQRGFMQQEIDYLAGAPSPNGQDAATIRLLRDDQALYIAVRVVDAIVENPFDGNDLYKGDCVEVFLDVRPLVSQSEPLLGDQKYSAGVCHIFLVPPTTHNAAPRWLDTNEKEAVIGPFDFSAKRLDDGYTIETRIPYSSLPGASAARLREPIGFDMLIDDRDNNDSRSGNFNVYSWGGLAGAFNNASRFGIADSNAAASRRSPYLRAEPARQTMVDGKPAIQATVVASRDTGDLKRAIELTSHFAASAFDRTLLSMADITAKGEPPVAFPRQPKIVRQEPRLIDYPQLGIQLQQETLRLEEVSPGRYTFQARFPRQKRADNAIRFYGFPYSSGVRLAEVAPQPAVTDILRGLASTEMSLNLEDSFPFIGEKATGTINFGLDSATAWSLSQWMEKNQKRENGFYSLELTAHNERGKVVQKQVAPLKALTNTVPFSFSALPAGRYTLRVSALAPNGQKRVVSYQQPYGDKMLNREATALLHVTPPRATVLQSTVADAPHLLRRAIEIGSPNRERFPVDDWADSYARSVRDLHVYDGRIYIGCGDWNANRGPIDIWSFKPVTGQHDVGQADFLKEFTVDDESVDIIRDYGGKLYVPGIDARESWEFGNLYVKDAGEWTKLRSIPRGLHVLDVAQFDGKLYVTTGTEPSACLYESTDDGKSWRLAVEDIDQYRFGRTVPLRDALLVMPYYGEQTPFFYSKGKPAWLHLPLFPRIKSTVGPSVDRLHAFNGGVVYTAHAEMLPPNEHLPLFFLQDFERGAVMVEQFQQDQVRDIKVENGTCYVLTGKPVSNAGTAFAAEVYSSRDLRSWTRLAAATLPAIPGALAIDSGKFYIGLGVDMSWYAPASQKVKNPASGSLWMLTE